MTKKMDQFLRHWIIGERMFSWFNSSPSPLPNRKSSCGWPGRISFLLFCFSLLIGLQKQVNSSSTQILRTAFLRFPARCCSSSWPICLSHEKLWPRSENCLCSQTKFWFPLRIHLAGNRLYLPIRAQFWCSLWSNLSVQMFLRLLAECTHDRPLNLWLVKILHKILSDLNNIEKSCIRTKFAQSVLLW